MRHKNQFTRSLFPSLICCFSCWMYTGPGHLSQCSPSLRLLSGSCEHHLGGLQQGQTKQVTPSAMPSAVAYSWSAETTGANRNFMLWFSPDLNPSPAGKETLAHFQEIWAARASIWPCAGQCSAHTPWLQNSAFSRFSNTFHLSLYLMFVLSVSKRRGEICLVTSNYILCLIAFSGRKLIFQLAFYLSYIHTNKLYLNHFLHNCTKLQLVY